MQKVELAALLHGIKAISYEYNSGRHPSGSWFESNRATKFSPIECRLNKKAAFSGFFTCSIKQHSEPAKTPSTPHPFLLEPWLVCAIFSMPPAEQVPEHELCCQIWIWTGLTVISLGPSPA